MSSTINTAKSQSKTISRVKPGHSFFVTVPLLEYYTEVRVDFINIFFDVYEYCVAVELNRVNNEEVKYHLHAYLKFLNSYFLSDLREYIVSVLDLNRIDIQSCRSRRNVVKYITKEDKQIYHLNIHFSEFNFYYQAYVWACNAVRFDFSDPFVVAHRNNYIFLQNYYVEVRRQLKKTFTGFLPCHTSFSNWSLEVAIWWNSKIVDNTKKSKNLYLRGLSNVGKSSYIESLIGKDNLDFVFYPSVGKFAYGDFDPCYHKIILFEEFSWKFHVLSMLKRLLEGRPFSACVKCKPDKLIEFTGPIIIITNEMDDVTDLAFVNRLQIVDAISPYWQDPQAEVPSACSSDTSASLSSS